MSIAPTIINIVYFSITFNPFNQKNNQLKYIRSQTLFGKRILFSKKYANIYSDEKQV